MRQYKPQSGLQRGRGESGISIVEFMMALAIMGILYGVAIPRYRQYQAQAKTLEAKLRLTDMYSAQQSFFIQYRTYATCLNVMGVGAPENDAHYASGFNLQTAPTPTNLPLPSDSGCTATIALNEAYWPANQIEGQWQVQVPGANPGDPPVDRAKAAADEDDLPTGTGGTAITAQSFVMGAAGVIFDNGTTTPSVDVWTIDQQKTINHKDVGY
ncbi:MAG: hypothetical protein OXB88_11285 [Bacteriovoracales bacterium]|nr:hypothetical protein [Bacteriovoracales bacterium]